MLAFNSEGGSPPNRECAVAPQRRAAIGRPRAKVCFSEEQRLSNDRLGHRPGDGASQGDQCPNPRGAQLSSQGITIFEINGKGPVPAIGEGIQV
jgi:hypothetical protein